MGCADLSRVHALSVSLRCQYALPQRALADLLRQGMGKGMTGEMRRSPESVSPKTRLGVVSACDATPILRVYACTREGVPSGKECPMCIEAVSLHQRGYPHGAVVGDATNS